MPQPPLTLTPQGLKLLLMEENLYMCGVTGAKHHFVVSYDPKYREEGFVLSYKPLHGGKPVGVALFPDRVLLTLDEVVDYINQIELGGL